MSHLPEAAARGPSDPCRLRIYAALPNEGPSMNLSPRGIPKIPAGMQECSLTKALEAHRYYHQPWKLPCEGHTSLLGYMTFRLKTVYGPCTL